MTLPDCMTLKIVNNFISVHVKGVLGQLQVRILLRILLRILKRLKAVPL